jgi:CheY-like chemotaxis protein
MLQNEIVLEKGPLPIPALARKRQLLVVDDSKAVREALSKMLASLGHGVTSARNGSDGGSLFCTRDYDLVIIDLQAPQMNVWELARIFKEHSPNIPVILATGFTEDKHWERAGTSCVDAIIPKPFKLKEMSKIVEMLLNGGP